MTIPLKHDRRSEPVPEQAPPQQAQGNAEPRRKPMQHAARGKRGEPGEAGAPEYYAKDAMPSVARPGPDGTPEGPDDGD